MSTTANTTVEKFTPGPWEVCESDDCHVDINALTPKEEHSYRWIVSVLGSHVRNTAEEMRGNAKLIAAAPDLYAACKEFVRKVEAGEAKSIKSYEQMKAAIKKATE